MQTIECYGRSMNKLEPSKIIRRLEIGVRTFSVVSVTLWLLWFFARLDSPKELILNAATASAIVAGLTGLMLGISLAVVRAPLSAKTIATFVASLAVCAWTGYVWWLIDGIYSGTWPY